MTRKQKRRRPAAGIEIVYEDERYSAVALDVPLFPSASIMIHVYAKPHHDLVFRACRLGLFFACKRCQREHLLVWWHYNRKVQADEPPYYVLCEDATDKGTNLWLVRPDEDIPAHLKAYRMFTITSDVIELLATIAAFINNQQYC